MIYSIFSNHDDAISTMDVINSRLNLNENESDNKITATWDVIVQITQGNPFWASYPNQWMFIKPYIDISDVTNGLIGYVEVDDTIIGDNS